MTDARERLEALAKGPPDHIPLHPYTAATYGDLRSILSQPLAGREQVDQMVDDFVADLDSARLRDRILSLLSPGAPVNTTAASCSESGENRTSGAPEGWREDLDRTLARAESLIDALMDNEPFDTAADGGVTVLMVWRHDAQSLRTEILKQRAALTSSSAKPGGEAWQPIETAPLDGQPILACDVSRDFGVIDGQQLPPMQTVVHWWGNPGEEGFYTSVNEIAPERPFTATHWKRLDGPQ